MALIARARAVLDVDGAAADGELELHADRLTFEPFGEGGEAPPRAVFPIEALARAAAAPGGLILDHHGRRYTFQGPAAAVVERARAAARPSLRPAPRSTASWVAPPVRPSAFFPGRSEPPPFALPGELQVGASHVRFLPNGRLPEGAGVGPPLSAAFSEILGVEVGLRPTPALVVHTAAARHELVVPEPAARAREIAAGMVARGAGPPEPGGEPPSPRAISAALMPWVAQLPAVPPLTRTRLAALAVLVDEVPGAWRGTLLVAAGGLFFLPPGPGRLVALDVSEVRVVDCPSEHEARLWARGRSLLLAGAPGSGFAARLRDALPRVPAATVAPPSRGRPTSPAARAPQAPRASQLAAAPLGDAAANRRDTFRVTASFDVSAQVLATASAGTGPTRISARLIDLSMGGCGLETLDVLPPESVVELTSSGGSFALRASLIHSTRLASGDGWRHGLRFEDVRDEAERHLRSLVMELQRRELARARGD